MSIPNGLVAAVHSHGSKESEMVLWSHQFDSPIAAVWRLSGGFIQPVTLLSEEVMPELVGSTSQKTFPQGPVMYIGEIFSRKNVILRITCEEASWSIRGDCQVVFSWPEGVEIYGFDYEQGAIFNNWQLHLITE